MAQVGTSSNGTRSYGRKVTVEYVCSGNEERSRAAAQLTTAALKERGLDGRVRVLSSGTIVRRMRGAMTNPRDTKMKLDKKLQVIRIAYRTGVYQGALQQDAYALLQ